MAETYSVYFGTKSGNLDLIIEDLEDTEITMPVIGGLNYGTTYYWRVDTTNEEETVTGDEWNFTTIVYYPPKPTGATVWDVDHWDGTITGENTIATIKKFVAIGNSQVWWENMSAGTMVELEAARDGIDTSDQLMMFEGYQKVFVVNGAVLRVIDFVNTKLTLNSGLTIAPAKGDIIEGASSKAKMVVDFVNTGMTIIYGYTISGTFIENAAETLSGGSISPTTRYPTAVDEATDIPHWYNWTVYPNSASGELPNKAYLGCLYRGRAILAGDPEYPQQWYMSRQANLWDFNYSVAIDDAQRPVKGGLGNAGQSGDIIRALIPYKDDYLILGCSTSMAIMTGDPAMMGPIDMLDSTTGIFGAKSWCLAGDGKLYFWGVNGLYATEIPGHPTCISAVNLPDLVKDEEASPLTHRISLEFNPIDYGIQICITLLADGSNSNYWYDLRAQGFFPDEFSDECGAYSLLYYPANDPDYADLLFGCKDGYIRKMDRTEPNDDTTTPIDSYVAFGPIQIAEDNKEGKIGNLTVITGGGAAGGHTDSDDIDYKIFTADTAEEVMEQLDANTAPKIAGTATNSGKGVKKDARKVRGTYGAIRLGNSADSETWSFEKLLIGK